MMRRYYGERPAIGGKEIANSLQIAGRERLLTSLVRCQCATVTGREKLAPARLSTTSIVLATTADFEHTRFFGFLAVFTAKPAAFFRPAVTSGMRAGCILFFRHTAILLSLIRDRRFIQPL